MQTVAVVPIFMSAGAAVLPTLMAAGASIAAVALKPRELARLARAHPRGMATGVLISVLAVSASAWGVHALMNPKRAPKKAGELYPWADVGRSLLRQVASGKSFTDLKALAAGTAAQQTPTTTASTSTGADDRYARTLFDGGESPTKLKQLWAYKPDDAMFLARPAITKTASGQTRIYAAACVADIGGYIGLLACVDGETGRPIWEIIAAEDQILKPFFSSPALTADGKYLVIGQGLHENRDCAMLCFDAATGKQKWAVKTPLHIESSPVIFGDLAIVGAGAIEGRDGRPTGNPGFVFAVNISTGEKVWEYPVIDPESSPAIDAEGTVYIGSGFNGEAIVALQSAPPGEIKGDRQLWKTAVGLPVTGEMTLAGDLVIAGAGNGDFVKSNANPRGVVVALDKKTGEVRWRTALEDSVLGSVSYRGDRVICTSRTGEVIALSVKDGAILWRTRINGRSPILAGTAFTDKGIYAISSDAYLAVLDPAKGTLIEKVPVNDPGKAASGLTGSPPQVFGGRVIVGTETGGLVSLFGTPSGGVP